MVFQKIQDSLFEHTAFIQQQTSGMLVRKLGEAVLVDSGLYTDTLNKLVWKSMPEAEGQEALREAEAWFAGIRPLLVADTCVPAGERPFAVWAGAETVYELGKIGLFLASRGYLEMGSEAGMILPLSAWSGGCGGCEGGRVVRVRTAAELAAFGSVVAANWTPEDEAVKTFFTRASGALLHEESPMRLYVLFAGEQAVACGELFLNRREKVGGLYMICTRESFRKRGFGTLMTATLLREAQAQGAALAVLQASQEGEGIYRRLGFKQLGVFAEYAKEGAILY